MARPILMPQVGQDLTEGKITGLNVKLGDSVKKGDIVAEVESEKAVFEVEAFVTGTVIEIRYKVGDMATVLEPIIMVGEAGETVAAAPAEKQAEKQDFGGESIQSIVAQASQDAPAKPASEPQREAAAAPSTGTHVSGKGGSSPLARRLAAAGGIDIAQVAGTGPHGAVVKRDIEAFRATPSAKSSSVVAFSGGAAATAAGGLQVRSLQQGTGDPVLLIHGFGGELSSWRPFVTHLGIANPILAIDLPGHGSAAGQAALDFDGLSASVRKALSVEKISRLHLVGHSLGAAVATEIAGGGDVDVRSLTLIAPAGLGPKINGDYVSGFLSSTTEAALKVWLELLVSNPASLPGVLVRATLAGREGTDMVANQKRLASGVFSGDTQLFSVREALARFGGPVRLVAGLADAIIPPVQPGAVPAHVGVHLLPNVGHLPQLEAASLVARLVCETVRSAG